MFKTSILSTHQTDKFKTHNDDSITFSSFPSSEATFLCSNIMTTLTSTLKGQKNLSAPQSIQWFVGNIFSSKPPLLSLWTCCRQLRESQPSRVQHYEKFLLLATWHGHPWANNISYDLLYIVVVGFVFWQQEIKISEVGKFVVYLKACRAKGSSSANGQKLKNGRQQWTVSTFPFYPREESPSPSTKGRIQSSPPFPARLRLFVSFPCLLLPAGLCLLVLSLLLSAAPAPLAPLSPPPLAPLVHATQLCCS